ncbi:MAG: folate family ECF transporter S component [Oscillospiraceae bacterium]|nr:folate family ECF transporter S component [Oscillospiraceae bacterium]
MKQTSSSKIAAVFRTRISVRILSQIAVLIALTYVLERLIPIINLPDLRITLSFIPMMICGMLFGPVWGAAAYGIADIIGWPIMGQPPIPLILTARIVNGFLFGFILHRENIKMWPHAILSALLVQIICGMWLTTMGLSQLRGVPYQVLLWMRLPQFGILIALQIIVFPVLLKLRYALIKAGHVTVKNNTAYKSE